MLKFLSIAAVFALAACVQSHPPEVTIKPAGFTIEEPEVTRPAPRPLTWQEELGEPEPETPPIKPVMITRVYDFDYANDEWKECLQ